MLKKTRSVTNNRRHHIAVRLVKPSQQASKQQLESPAKKNKLNISNDDDVDFSEGDPLSSNILACIGLSEEIDTLTTTNDAQQTNTPIQPSTKQKTFVAVNTTQQQQQQQQQQTQPKPKPQQQPQQPGQRQQPQQSNQQRQPGQQQPGQKQRPQ